MPRTTEQVLHQQQQDAERDKQPPAPRHAVAPATSTAVAPADNRAARMRYLEEVAGGMPGRLIRFNIKENKFTTIDDGSEVPDVDYIALCPEVLIGWIKFNDDDLPPERIMGLLFDGFKMPPQDEPPDRDRTQWPEGLSGAPEDPWKHQMALPLMNTSTQELLVFTTLNDTGRRAVGRLLQHYERMLRLNPQRAAHREIESRRLQPSRPSRRVGEHAAVCHRRPHQAGHCGKDRRAARRRIRRRHSVLT